jgi:glycosyltransferase involved in cell wall biosynthesis
LPDDKVLLWFGRLRRYKGIGDLLEVFAKLRAPGYRLVVAGANDGP